MIAWGRRWLESHGSSYAKAWVPVGGAIGSLYLAWEPHGVIESGEWRRALGYLLLGYGVALVPNRPRPMFESPRPKGYPPKSSNAT